MNFSFSIELYPEGEGDYATLYTYRIASSEQTELDRFLSDPEVLGRSDYNVLVDRIWRMLDELGLYHRQSDFGASRWFRDESNFRDPDDDACAFWAPIPEEDRADLAPPYPSLRLYCFRLEQMLIADNGVVKRTLRNEDDPELMRKLGQLKYVMKRLKRRIDEGAARIVEDGFLLEGNLHFEAEPLL